MEHTWWVVFEDCFLVLNSANGIREMRTVAIREAQLSWGAYYDVLTGLPNRRALQERFDASVSACKERARAIFFIDLDRFKQVNDTLGHTVGDKLLKQVSTRLMKALDPAATLARIGGDEFIVIHEMGGSARSPEEEAERLIADCNRPFDVDHHQFLLSASIGIARYPEHGTEIRELQDRADHAMYVAKAQGRNQFVTFSTEIATQHFVQEIASDHPQALARDKMSLCFQPSIHDSGSVAASFAALRISAAETGTPMSPQV